MSATLPAQLGRFRVVRPLSQGAAGTLCLGEEVQSRAPVLLTVPHFGTGVDAGLAERFHHEARLISQVSHPSLCPVYETGHVNGLHYLASAPVEGASLTGLIGRPWPPAQAVFLVAHLAGALYLLHQRGVVYREVSPATVLVRGNGTPLLTDGCLARCFSAAQLRSGHLAGQPAYLAPEQLLGQEQMIGPHTDVWALGVILYQLLTGTPPFVGQSFLALRDQIVAARPAAPSSRLPGLDPRLDAVCLQMLSRDPAQRMAGLQGLGHLVAAMQQPSAAHTPLAPTPVTRPQRSGGLILVAVCLAGTLLLLAGLGALFVFGLLPHLGNGVVEATTPATETGRTAATGAVVATGSTTPAARPRLQLTAPAGLLLEPGQSGIAAVGVRLSEATGDVTFRQEGEAPGLSLTLPRALAKQNSAEVVVKAEAGARPGPVEVTLVASGPQGTSDRVQFRVTVVAPAAVTEPRHVLRAMGMKFVEIPAGKFRMGSPRALDDGTRLQTDELPQHEVQISRPFLLGMYEVTQGEFERVMNYSPSWFGPDGGGAERIKGVAARHLPVERVTWEEAVAFCKKLSELPEEKQKGRTYRLPTEAEWEYACRAGGPAGQDFGGGNTLDPSQANFAGPTRLRRTAVVGSYKPNAWGLFDMHGNVAEWCGDWYGDTYYSRGQDLDPAGPTDGTARVVRGGSWLAEALRCRCARRDRLLPSVRDESIGFRVVCVPSSP